MGVDIRVEAAGLTIDSAACATVILLISGHGDHCYVPTTAQSLAGGAGGVSLVAKQHARSRERLTKLILSNR